MNPFWFPQRVAYKLCLLLLRIFDWLLPVAAPIELIDWSWDDRDRRIVLARLYQVLNDFDKDRNLNTDIYRAAKRIMERFERRRWRF